MNSFDIRKFEAVIFDLDSTLTDTHNYPMVASEWLLQKSGVFSEDQMTSYIHNLVTRYRAAIQAIVEGAPYQSPFDIIKVAMENSLRDLDVNVNNNLIEAGIQRFKTLHIDLSTPHEGVDELLGSLKAKAKKLGVVSNSFEGHAKIILKKLSLDHYFTSILDCGDVKAFKPMSALFERVARDLDIEIYKTIYVGDEYYADMVGAKDAGMITIWINNRERSLSDLITKYGVASSPDYVLNSVSEMCKML